jgi:regulator of sirC expression with transglutaminase-like and TPR domain
MTPHDYFATLVAAPQSGIALPPHSLPLTEAALSIAQDVYPRIKLDALQLDIDRLAASLKLRLPSDAGQMHRLRSLNRYFFGELGFSANRNDYYDPDNSYLNRVLERRLGIPISLAILYMEIGQQIGLPLRGVSFPGHFLVKLRIHSANTHGEVFLDPCDGQSLSRENLEERLSQYLDTRDLEVPAELALIPAIQEATPREILARMLRNLKGIYQDQRHFEKLLDVQKRLVILLPDEALERRDRGLVYAQLDCPRAALDDLNFYVQQRPDAADADVMRGTIATLRDASGRLN